MPILPTAKKRIGGLVVNRMLPTFGSNPDLSQLMAGNESEGQSPKELKEGGAMALRALFSAMQDGNYEAAFKAFCTAYYMADSLEDLAEDEEMD